MIEARRIQPSRLWAALAFVLPLLLGSISSPWSRADASDSAPVPLLEVGKPVSWWFAFKFNSASFPACGTGIARACSFGGEVQDYSAFGEQFAYASSRRHSLALGSGCIGDDASDPVGATFGEVYDGSYNYAVWNDQFYGDPKLKCGKSCGGPWGHSKGMVAWNDSGEGLVLQVTTPSWPASGSKSAPRQHDGNTLGCVDDNNVLVSQHFLAVKLNKRDLMKVLQGLQNASIVTDPDNTQIVHNGGPANVQTLVKALGTKSTSETATKEALSSGILLISKPSRLHVPPWQLVSALLGGVGLRTATWWMEPKIGTTEAETPISCWDAALPAPGPVEIATTGHWKQTDFGLAGGASKDKNHAKIGVSISGNHHYAIFGDMNQQGAISGSDCDRSQNGRGGLFFVFDDAALQRSVADLISGDTAPAAP